MYTHVSILWIKGNKVFRDFMCHETHHKYFGSGWSADNEVHMHIVYIIDYIKNSSRNFDTIYCVWC